MTWETVPLGQVAELRGGIVFPPALQGRTTGDYPFAKVADIGIAARSSGRIEHARNYVSDDDVELLRARIVPSGSTLFAKIGESVRLNARALSTRPLLVDNNAMAAIPSSKIDSRYLYRFLQTVDLGALASTTSVPSVRKSDLDRVGVPLPPLAEQRRIAAILDEAAGALINQHLRSTQLGLLESSLFLSKFGSPTRNPKGWESRPFDATMRDVTASSPKLPTRDFTSFGRWPIIDQSRRAIAGYTDDAALVTLAEEGVVVFGDHTRAVKLVTSHFVLGADGAKVLAPAPGVRAPYLAGMLKLREIPDLGYSRHMRVLKSLTFPVPPVDAQDKYARQLMSLEDQRRREEQRRDSISSLFASLQHRAFRGEL